MKLYFYLKSVVGVTMIAKLIEEFKVRQHEARSLASKTEDIELKAKYQGKDEAYGNVVMLLREKQLEELSI